MIRASIGLVACLLGTAACSGLDAGVEEDEGGTVELSLTDAPADARCLVVNFDGAKHVERALELTPGEEAHFTLERLPVGLTTVDAKAYAVSCGSVAARTVPSYVLEAPLTVRIRGLELTRIILSLVKSGRLGIDVEFEDGGDDSKPITLAVFGDTPYGAAQVAAFPQLIASINAANVDLAVHVGDIKNGSTRCDTSYFQKIFDDFSALNTPLVYTPGDNEWTDCHRANNGAYDPLERLDVLRSVFFGDPGTTLGEPKAVLSQASIPAHSAFVENRLWFESGVAFATVHVVGSANGYAPWFGTDTTGTKHDDPDRRIAEAEARIAAGLDWINREFDLAAAQNAKAVVVFMQADTFVGSTEGFVETLQLLARRARAFEKPVLLVQGDSHRYLVDVPFETGNAAYGVSDAVPNLTRIVVEGETASQWLSLTVDPNSPSVFSWRPVLL
jgi:hypothetical protein